MNSTARQGHERGASRGLRRLGAASGVAYLVVSGVGNGMATSGQPGVLASGEEILAWYKANTGPAITVGMGLEWLGFAAFGGNLKPALAATQSGQILTRGRTSSPWTSPSTQDHCVDVDHQPTDLAVSRACWPVPPSEVPFRSDTVAGWWTVLLPAVQRGRCRSVPMPCGGRGCPQCRGVRAPGVRQAASGVQASGQPFSAGCVDLAT
jgi:hypothetical protein